MLGVAGPCWDMALVAKPAMAKNTRIRFKLKLLRFRSVKQAQPPSVPCVILRARGTAAHRPMGSLPSLEQVQPFGLLMSAGPPFTLADGAH